MRSHRLVSPRTLWVTALFAAAVAVVAWNHLRARFDMLVGRAALDIIALPDIMPPS